MADLSPSSDPHQDSNPDCLGFGKSERLFHSANWTMDSLKVYWKTQADRVLKDENFSRYCFLLPSELYVAGSCMEKESTFCGMKVRLWRSLI